MRKTIYQTTSNSGDFRVNEDGTVTRIPKIENTSNKDSNNPNNNNNRNNNNHNNNDGCGGGVFFGIVLIIIFNILVNFKPESNKEETIEADDSTLVISEEDNEPYRRIFDSSLSASYLNLSTQTLYVPSDGGNYEVYVETDGKWHISTGIAYWGNITPNKGSIIINISPNDSGLSRTDFFEISAGGITRRINIYQQGNTRPSAEIQSVWIDHNVYQGGQNGMRIHVRFTVDNMLNKKTYVSALFYYNDNISPIYDYYGKHLVFSDFAYPSYSGCIFDDFKLFVPYDAIVLDDEYVSIGLSFDISILTSSGEQLARKKDIGFVLHQEY